MKVFYDGASPALQAMRHAKNTGEKCIAFYPADTSRFFLSRDTMVEQVAMLVGSDGIERRFSITRIGN